MTYTGKAHNAIIAELFDQIKKESSVQTQVVESHKKLQGISEKNHQFDVYWEFQAREKTHRCAIEAKYWDKPVSLQKLSRFRKDLNDVQASLTGIFLASSGFEKHARVYAQRQNIDVWIYPFSIEVVNEEVTFFVAKFEHVSPVFDDMWIEKVLKPKLQDGASLPVNPDDTDQQTRLFDEYCAAKTVREVLNEYYLAEMIDVTAHEICVLFDKPTYIETGNLDAPLLKLKGLNAVFSMTSHIEALRHVSKDYARRAVEFITVLFNDRRK
jgi:Restriction endonuclease